MRGFLPLSGTLTVQIISAEPAKVLEAIVNAGITVSGITFKSELSYEFRISHKEFHRLSRILRKNDCKMRIVRRDGLYWNIRSLMTRPVLMLSVLMTLILSFCIPKRILFIEVDGNQKLTAQEIIAAADYCGLSFGTPRKEVRSEKVKNELLSVMPELQWAGINTAGCRAVISVKEGSRQELPPPKNIVSNIVADRDAYILAATVTAGTAMVHPGDSVISGQTLISGYADHGYLIHATRASGEIQGLTNRDLTAVLPANYLHITPGKEHFYKISLLIRKKRINLWIDSRISDTGCGRMYEEYFVSLPGGFQLPIAVCIDRYYCHETQSESVHETEAPSILQRFSDKYLTRQMTAGQILQMEYLLRTSEGRYQLKCNYICTEIIGREQREQIGVNNGKRD